MVKVVVLLGCGWGKDHHCAKSFIPVIMEYVSTEVLCKPVSHFCWCTEQWW